MTRAEIRREMQRVTLALRRADRRLEQAHYYTVLPMDPDDRDGPVMRISRTARGDDDAGHYLVEIDPDQTSELSLRNLRVLAGHEAIHAMLWPMGGRGAREEAVAYRLQRILFGEVRE